ncbi:glycosyltransferase family 2 protein [Pseudomonas sp. A-B-26]|uniref:glycosyltransferase family 2 protein n=1 Tax=Pseudomonas sp. A-B-26 TaxID=2832406 RepID=UPI001CBF2A7E|nr:glycosyltransferase family 2 protein [Pseudomonas sp. A-B-26]
MDKKYNFSYEPVSVYACAVDLVRKYSCAGAIHIDLGCGYAAIARQIERGGVRYIGFDANQDSIKTLQSYGIEAYELNLLDHDAVVSQLRSLCENYSTVTVSILDVIEHLDYDCVLLSRIKEAFSSEQKLSLVISVPNFSHVDIAVKLLAGNFDYLDTGLLDKTHTVVYTKHNLSEVTRKNGWREVAANDYHLEFSEQFLEQHSVILNRDCGIGQDLRRLKAVLDPSSDVYQFVRAYVPDDSVIVDGDNGFDSADISVSLVFAESVSDLGVTALYFALSEMEEQAKVELVLPNKFLGKFDGELTVSYYKEGGLESYVAASLNTRYWSFVKVPEEVCVSALGALIDHFDDARGTPLLELVKTDGADDSRNQYQLFASLNTDSSWRLMIPADYAGQFQDSSFSNGDEEWRGFARRAALACGISRVAVEFSTVQAILALPMDRPTAFSYVFTDPVARSYIVRSDVWAGEFFAELQNLSEQNSVFRLDNQALDGKCADLQLQLSDLDKQLGDIVTSKSWTLTRPLRGFRRRVSRAKDVVCAVLRRPRSTLRGCARAIYLRVPGLKFVWSFYLYRKMRLAQIIQDKTFSADNLHALNALSNNRFTENARFNVSKKLADFPEIDVSIVAYNSARWVAKFVASLELQNYPLSKINLKVVDNGSSDNTVALFEEYLNTQGSKFSSSEVIRQENLGFGAGHDRAIRKGTSEFCLIVNLDLEFLPDSIVKAVTSAVNDGGTSAASWEFRQIPYEHPKYYDPVTLETNWSSHACILLKREAYLRSGGYDHAIFMYGEDVELSYRLRSFGYSLKYLPGATVLHHTYEEAGEIKPLQFAGSVLGNTYIRLRYGSYSDRFIAFVLYAALFIYPSQFPGSKKMLRRNVPTLLKNILHFLKGKGPAPVKFPFRGYDYELIRDGAFWSAEPLQASGSIPKVTVITRTYNGRGMFLRQAMQSVFNQTYPNIELLVAEDGGDSQSALVSSMAEAAPSNVSVRFLANEKIGRSGVGNAAMADASGAYFMFLDDDDLLFSDHVETLMQCLNADTSVDAAYSLAFEVTTHVNEDKTSYVEELFHTPTVFRQEWDYEVMQRHNFIPIQSIIFKKDLYLRWGGFDLELDQLEDWSLWLCYGFEGSFRYVGKTTSLFRTPADQNVRAERHALLHGAYDIAVASARRRIGEVVGHPLQSA